MSKASSTEASSNEASGTETRKPFVISGTTAAIAAGYVGYNKLTRWELWRRYVENDWPQDTPSVLGEVGLALEPLIERLYKAREPNARIFNPAGYSGRLPDGRPAPWVSPRTPWRVGTIDRIALFLDTCTIKVVDLKSRADWARKDWEENGPSPKEKIQVRHYALLVRELLQHFADTQGSIETAEHNWTSGNPLVDMLRSGKNIDLPRGPWRVEGALAVLFGRGDADTIENSRAFQIFEVDCSDARIHELQLIEERFARCVLENIEPEELEPEDVQKFREFHAAERTESDTAIQATDYIEQLTERYFEVETRYREANALKRKLDEIKARIEGVRGGSQRPVYVGNDLAWQWTTTTRKGYSVAPAEITRMTCKRWRGGVE